MQFRSVNDLDYAENWALEFAPPEVSLETIKQKNSGLDMIRAMAPD